MSKRYSAFYIKGLENVPRPGKTYVIVKKNGLSLLKQDIHWASVKDFKIDYEISNQQGGTGAAIVGGMIAGEAGAIVGGMRTTKKVEPNVTLTYVSNSGDRTLVFIVDKAEEVEKSYRKYAAKAQAQAAIPAIPTKPKEPLGKRILKIYFALYIIPFKYIKKHLNKDPKA